VRQQQLKIFTFLGSLHFFHNIKVRRKKIGENNLG
jgi:hypothetical protein